MFLPKLLPLLACTATLAPAVLADHHETSLEDALANTFASAPRWAAGI
ncbi:MAG TPA: hypothetical protein VGA56_16360 [Opitutaceae bacterium]